MSDWPEIREEPEPEDPDPQGDRAAELDGVRIRQLAALRRAAYRSRSHAVIAMLVCAVAAVHACILLIQHSRHFGWGWKQLVYLIFVLAGAWGTRFFTQRALLLHREVTQTHGDTPAAPPDFSTLSDGSQRWKHLDELK